MKRLFRVILFAICAFLLAGSVFAVETTTYHLEDVNISLDIPDDFIVFTRTSKADDPNFALYGISKDDLDALFEERSIYLNAWDEEVNFEILVTMTDSSFEDFNLVSDTTLSALNSIITDSFESRGAECIKSGIYQHSQAKFLRAYYRQVENDNTIYAIQYFTSYDGKAICIALRSTTGEIDASENNILNEIVDSVRFDVDPVKPEEPDHTPSFRYYDKDTGISFTVPENWSQTEFNEERKFLTAKFSSNLEAGLYIIYSGADYWNELPAYEKSGKTRKDIDMSEISMQDFASMLGISSKDLSREYYDGKEYYKAVAESVENELGLDWPAVYLMHIENGYLAWFQFNGSDSSPYYKDFEAMVSSTEYPGSGTPPTQDTSESESFDVPLATEEGAATEAPSESQESMMNESTENKAVKNWIAIPILIGMVLIFGIIAIKNRAARKKTENLDSEENKHSVDSNSLLKDETEHIFGDTVIGKMADNSQEVSGSNNSAIVSALQIPIVPRKIQFCRHCGNKLIEGSKFCNNCGTKIEEESSN